jgi:hypothetical protein
VAGTGITRTAHEVAARADRLGMLVLWGRSLEGTYGRLYGALADALEEYASGLEDQLDADLGRGAAALHVTSVWARCAPGGRAASGYAAKEGRVRPSSPTRSPAGDGLALEAGSVPRHRDYWL